LAALPGQKYFFKAHDKGPESVLVHLQKDCPASAEIELKEGKRYLLLRIF
jgi:hypothetical protein